MTDSILSNEEIDAALNAEPPPEWIEPRELAESHLAANADRERLKGQIEAAYNDGRDAGADYSRARLEVAEGALREIRDEPNWRYSEWANSPPENGDDYGQWVARAALADQPTKRPPWRTADENCPVHGDGDGHTCICPTADQPTNEGVEIRDGNGDLVNVVPPTDEPDVRSPLEDLATESGHVESDVCVCEKRSGFKKLHPAEEWECLNCHKPIAKKLSLDEIDEMLHRVEASDQGSEQAPPESELEFDDGMDDPEGQDDPDPLNQVAGDIREAQAQGMEMLRDWLMGDMRGVWPSAIERFIAAHRAGKETT